MNEYLTELRHALPGGAREREALLARFRAAMAPLEEEIGPPGYDDLVAAFGPPEEMAKTLAASPEGQAALAHARRSRRLVRGLSAAVAVCLVVAVAGLGAHTWRLSQEDRPGLSQGDEPSLDVVPEKGTYLPGVFREPVAGESFSINGTEPLVHSDVVWSQQEFADGHYWIAVRNDGTEDLRAWVRYSPRAEDRLTFTVPAGESGTFQVADGNETEHRVSFLTDSGALVGAALVGMPAPGAAGEGVPG